MFKPGDKIKCIDVSELDSLEDYLKLGNIYTVKRYNEDGDYKIVNLIGDQDRIDWLADRFILYRKYINYPKRKIV